MAGDGAFAAVGAAPGVRNPIAVASALLSHGRRGLMPLGRIPPLFLAGDGARRWAADHGLATADDADDADYNVCAVARRRWQDHCRRLHDYCRAAGHGLEGPPAEAGPRAEIGGGGDGAGCEDHDQETGDDDDDDEEEEEDGLIDSGPERDHDTVGSLLGLTD